jgi:hypothetical protein
MLFISVRSATVENVPKVLHVVEEIRRLRHKAGTSSFCDLSVLCSEFRAGMDEEGELHQYVIYEQTKQKGPKIIKLDDPKNKNSERENYTPPNSLTVHLSKIDMPELKPRATGRGPTDEGTTKEWDKKGKGKEKEKGKEKPAKQDKRKEGDKKRKPTPSPPPGKLAKPSGSKPPSPGHQGPPPIPHHTRPPTNTQPPGLPQLGSAVSNLMGRLDRFTKR